jgi:type I restriction enzyme, S subunit
VSQSEGLCISRFLDREIAKIDALIEEQRRLIALLQERRQAVISHAVTKGLDPSVPMKDSGVDWLGYVPGNWSIKPVSAVASLINGYPFDSSAFDLTRGAPLVRIRDLNKTETEIRYDGEHPVSAVITKQDLLIGMDGDFNVGRWLGEGTALLNQRMCCVRGGSGAITRMLEYTLPMPLRRINELTYSTTVKHLASSQIEKIRLAWPQTSDEVVALLDFLDHETAKIDSLIEQQQRLITLLQERRSALISAAVTGKIDLRDYALREPVASEELDDAA